MVTALLSGTKYHLCQQEVNQELFTGNLQHPPVPQCVSTGARFSTVWWWRVDCSCFLGCRNAHRIASQLLPNNKVARVRNLWFLKTRTYRPPCFHTQLSECEEKCNLVYSCAFLRKSCSAGRGSPGDRGAVTLAQFHLSCVCAVSVLCSRWCASTSRSPCCSSGRTWGWWSSTCATWFCCAPPAPCGSTATTCSGCASPTGAASPHRVPHRAGIDTLETEGSSVP